MYSTTPYVCRKVCGDTTITHTRVSTIFAAFCFFGIVSSPMLQKVCSARGRGWCENSTRWKSRKRARARGIGTWACLTHGLQCLCDGRACCPARALQLVICRS
jgi:hypothetical protein